MQIEREEKRRMVQKREKEEMSSDSDSDERETRVFKLKSRSYFPKWKQKTLSMAISKGFDQFLTDSISVKTQDELDNIEIDYINEADEEAKRVKKRELRKLKRERKRSLAAAAMLTSSVRSKDLKLLAKCKLNPKKMFDAICTKYGSEEDSDVTDLLEDFKECILKSKRKDPEDWYGDPSGKRGKRNKVMTKTVRAVTAVLVMTVTTKAKAKVKSKDKYALTVDNEKKDSVNAYGVLVCGNCGKLGHGIANYWSLHGRPEP